MSSQLTKQIINAVKQSLPVGDGVFPLHAPTFQGNEWEYVKECIDTTWVSSVGKYVDRFEEELAKFTGTKRAIAVTNGTAALHLSLLLAGVKPNDEVLIPALSFVATANAVVYCHATPHFVDINRGTLGVDSNKLARYLENETYIANNQLYNKNTNECIRAIVPMHTFGHPVEMDELLVLANKYHLKVVEDAAEGLGSFYKEKHVGSFGEVSALSFNGNKIITTGGGGAVLTNDDELADRAKHLSTVAKLSHQFEYVHDEIGYNYRMPNINAALGCAQLEQLPRFLNNKERLSKKYQEEFKKINGVQFFVGKDYNQPNHWLHAIILEEENISLRNDIIQSLHQEKIIVRPVWQPLNKLKMYEKVPKMDLTATESLSARIINLPSSVME